MTDPAETTGMMTLQRPLVGALVRHLHLPVGAFGSAFVEMPEDSGYLRSVAGWWNSLRPADQTPRHVLATLAAPALVVDMRVMFGQESWIRSWALAGGASADAPWILAALRQETDEYQIRTLSSREEILGTLLRWIEGHAGLFVPEMKVKLAASELAVLMAVVDLYSRARYSAYINHGALSDRLPVEHVVRGYQEATTIADPRWLLSFADPFLPVFARGLEPDAIRQAVASLARRGLLQQAASSGEVSLTDPGRFLAESWHRRVCLVALDVAGADEEGNLGTHAGMFIRSDEPLWYCDIGSDGDATVMGADIDLTRRLLEALLTAGGVPPLAADLPAGRSAPVPPAQKASSPPPQPLRAATPAFCAKCGSPLNPGMKFCGQCGARFRA